MNITIIKKLPSVEDIIGRFPLSESGHRKINRDRNEIKDILNGKDSRFLIIVGPCSAWPKEAVLEYAKKLKNLEMKLRDHLKIVMRVYIQKPRTTKGWTGPINQPDPLEKANVENGIFYSREMMVKILELGLPIADEVLFTHNAKSFQELLSWVAIGARSTEDQEHRIFASALGCAVGLKNPTYGSIDIGVNSVVAAQYPHIAILDGHEVQTHGNPYAHLILRGGQQGTNYSKEDIDIAEKEMKKHGIKNPAILIDASHDNSIVDGIKNHKNQILVVRESLNTFKNNPELLKIVKGFMLESFIKEGNQKVDPNNKESLDRGGLSITDACLSWEQTEEILLELTEFKKLL